MIERPGDLRAREHDRVLDQLLLAAGKMMADRTARRSGMAHHVAHAGAVDAAPAHQISRARHHPCPCL
jgi:hypothetical protein